MRHEMLTQRGPFCIGVMAKKGTLSQHFVTHVVPPLDACIASSPGPLYFLVLRGPGVRKYIMLRQHGCVLGDASFHHDIVPECLWPSSSLV